VAENRLWLKMQTGDIGLGLRWRRLNEMAKRRNKISKRNEWSCGENERKRKRNNI
jgi:hypothetical protein